MLAWSIDWLIDWLIGWLVGWLIDSFSEWFRSMLQPVLALTRCCESLGYRRSVDCWLGVALNYLRGSFPVCNSWELSMMKNLIPMINLPAKSLPHETMGPFWPFPSGKKIKTSWLGNSGASKELTFDVGELFPGNWQLVVKDIVVCWFLLHLLAIFFPFWERQPRIGKPLPASTNSTSKIVDWLTSWPYHYFLWNNFKG